VGNSTFKNDRFLKILCFGENFLHSIHEFMLVKGQRALRMLRKLLDDFWMMEIRWWIS